MGEDEITIGNNRFTHFQAGGSNDRWETTETIRLAPQTLLRVDSCGFRGTDPDSVDFTVAELSSMDIRSLAIADAAKAGTGDEGGCGVMQKGITLPPGPGFVGGRNVPMPNLGSDPTNPVVFPGNGGRMRGPAGCQRRGSGAGLPSYAGRSAGCASSPPAPGLVSDQGLRPDKAKPASWVGADHLEIWTLLEPGDSYL